MAKFTKKTIALDNAEYECVKIIGKGQFGLIYEGKVKKKKVAGIRFPKKVAIKEYFYQRFYDPSDNSNKCDVYWKREINALKVQEKFPLSQLHFIDAGIIGSKYYIVFTYIDHSQTLREWFSSRYPSGSPINADLCRWFAFEIVLPLAQHLDFCHKNGLVHRDLSIDNILIKMPSKNAVIPVIIDWGASKIRSVHDLFNVPPNYVKSSYGSFTGTSFMNKGTPPEILVGKQPVAASDIYMLGHIMYFLFTGGKTMRTPTIADDYILRPKLENPNVPDELDSLVQHCTQYEPADRPKKMEHIVHILEKLKKNFDPSMITYLGKAPSPASPPQAPLASSPNIPVSPLSQQSSPAGVSPSSPSSSATQGTPPSSTTSPSKKRKRKKKKNQDPSLPDPFQLLELRPGALPQGNDSYGFLRIPEDTQSRIIRVEQALSQFTPKDAPLKKKRKSAQKKASSSPAPSPPSISHPVAPSSTPRPPKKPPLKPAIPSLKSTPNVQSSNMSHPASSPPNQNVSSPSLSNDPVVHTQLLGPSMSRETILYADAFLKYFNNPLWKTNPGDKFDYYEVFYRGLLDFLKAKEQTLRTDVIKGNIYYIGRLGGSLDEIRIIGTYIQKVLQKAPETRFVFLGIYLGGEYDLECLTYLLSLYALYSKNIVVLRSHTETQESINKYLEKKIKSKFSSLPDKGSSLLPLISSVNAQFDLIHIAQFDKNIHSIATGGGIPYSLFSPLSFKPVSTLKDILNERKESLQDMSDYVKSILMGVPNEKADTIIQDSRGFYYFSWSQIREFFKVNSIQFMFRPAYEKLGYRIIWNMIANINSTRYGLTPNETWEAKIVRVNKNGISDLAIRDLKFYFTRDYS